MKSILLFGIILLLAGGLWAQTSPKMIVSDYMGINTNVAAYDNKYLADLSKCVKWIREYHDWSHYEAANNFYKWDNYTKEPGGNSWPEHNLFMNQCKSLGISVLVDVLGTPSWVGTSRIPNNSGTGSNASDYMERLEFIGQLVARYGSKKIDVSLLETADKVTGLNFIKYYEDDNEPDYTWETPRWTAENYAKYCNAVHDGFGVQTDIEHPLLGIKSVDPDAKHVMAGMASSDTTYMNIVLKASGGRVPFDVLNVHWYCTDMTNAYSPEHETYGYEKGYRNFFKWKNRVLPNHPVWITEFGWDTYLAADKKHSYTYAPAPQQANYILRAYMVLLKMGFEKSFLFMDADTDSKYTLQYATSGLLMDKALKYAKKPSYYYLATMQNVLGKTSYSKAISFKEVSGANEVYCLEFDNAATSEKVYVLWTRATNSKTDNGATTAYELKPGYKVVNAYSVLPADLDMNGDTIVPTVTDNSIQLTLSETPQFVVVSGSGTASALTPSEGFDLKVYPNPAKGQVQIDLLVSERQQISLTAWSAEGKLLKKMVDGPVQQGIHHYNFGSGQGPGAYLLSLTGNSGKIVKKVVLLKN